MTDQLTAADALGLVRQHVQWCRVNGESDMRNVLHFVNAVYAAVHSGKSGTEILAQFADEGEDD